MDNYNSHEGQLYCQIHFKQLLRPKPVDNQDDLDLIASMYGKHCICFVSPIHSIDFLPQPD